LTEALGRSFEQHIVGLKRYAVALLGDSIEADDLVQECLVRALSREHVWTRVRDRRAYLFTILHNIYVDRRAQHSRYGYAVPIEDVAYHLSCPPKQLERLEIRDLKKALGELPDNYKVVILLIGLEGLSYRQAADVLEVPIGTIMSRLSRGRELLRRYMNGGIRNIDDGSANDDAVMDGIPQLEKN
jgi:RNA polymerase sigma-70 factor (ECF subfamily)